MVSLGKQFTKKEKKYVKNDENLNFGEFIKCKVTQVDEYDLVSEKIKK